MASKRLLDKRLEHEAAERMGKSPTKKKKATRKKASTTTRKRKTKAPERKRLMWGVFSGTLKEEGRYLWNEKDKAEEKLAQLRAKSKKLFFIQPIKESLSESEIPVEEEVPPPVDEDDESLDDESSLDDDDEDDDDDDGDDEEE